MGYYAVVNLQAAEGPQLPYKEPKSLKRTTTSAPGNPWDKIEDIQLPDSFDDNIHSVFSLKNYKQYVAEKEAELHDSDYKDGVLVTSKTNDDDIQGETIKNEDDYKKRRKS